MSGRADCIGTFVNNGLLMPRVWAQPDYSFDNIGKVRPKHKQTLALNGAEDLLSSNWCGGCSSTLQHDFIVQELLDGAIIFMSCRPAYCCCRQLHVTRPACILQAIFVLFQLATLDNWGDCMFATLDITGYNTQPRQNASWANSIFFIVFVCISAHLVIKTFIAIFTEQVLPGLFLPMPRVKV